MFPRSSFPPSGEELPLDPIVLLLKEFLALTGQSDALDEAVKTALKSNIPQLEQWGITSAEGFLRFANRLLKWIPQENFEGKDIYWSFCVFYFILDRTPLLDNQTPVQPTEIGKPLTWLSAWIVCFAERMGSFLDTPESITATSYQSFLNSPKFNIEECVVPPGGFKTFNELFARRLLPGRRPVAGPANDNVVVFPVDSTFDGAWDISNDSEVSIKGISWPIAALLNDSKYKNEFKGGIWTHSFLNTFDYHRQHAPVKGRIVEAKVIRGAAYLEVVVTQDRDGRNTLAPIRRYHHKHAVSDLHTTADAPDNPGYQFLQMRGLIMIDSPTLGLVAVLPIGMAQVSSVKLSISVGEEVEKGQELSYFQFGGSDCVIVFQKGAGLTKEDFPEVNVPPVPLKHSLMGEQLVVAHPIWDGIASRFGTC